MTQLLDPAYIRATVGRSMAVMELMAVFATGGLEAAGRSKNERARIGRVAATKLMGGLPPNAARQMGEVFVAFFGEGIVVRHLPCGAEHRRNALIGTLADVSGYLADSREALFSKYGSAPSDWTLLAQVATVSAQPSPDEDPEPEEDESDEGELDRSLFEGIAAGILRGLEDAG